jgi:hypothetical protein
MRPKEKEDKGEIENKMDGSVVKFQESQSSSFSPPFTIFSLLTSFVDN